MRTLSFLAAATTALIFSPAAQAIDVRVRVSVPKLDAGRQVQVRVSGLDCTVAQQRVRFAVTSRGVTRSTSDVPCSYDWTLLGNMGDFTMPRLTVDTYFHTNLSEAKDTGVGVAEFRLTPHDRTGVHTVRWRVHLDGVQLRTGAIRWRSRYTPGRRIWQGTDAFVNYCIEYAKKLRSENLRLYCVRPSEITRTAAVLP